VRRQIPETRKPVAEDYRKLLRNKKAELLVALGLNSRALAEAEKESGEDSVPLSHEEFIRLRLNRVLYGQLRMVEDALERMGLGEYGVCTDCGAPIAPKRLQAVPWARYCLDCQERANVRYASDLLTAGKGI